MVAIIHQREKLLDIFFVSSCRYLDIEEKDVLIKRQRKTFPPIVYLCDKIIVFWKYNQIMSDMRFHDLRHTYAVNSLKAGDDIKTLQENLGHATAAFTLSTYAHATPNMKTEGARRMNNFIHTVMSEA